MVYLQFYSVSVSDLLPSFSCVFLSIVSLMLAQVCCLFYVMMIKGSNNKSELDWNPDKGNRPTCTLLHKYVYCLDVVKQS